MKSVAVVSGLLGVLGCGNDQTTASAEACRERGGAACFILPVEAIRAAGPLGRFDTPMLDCPSYEITIATDQITLQGKTRDLYLSPPVANVRVEVFADREMTRAIADATSDDNGNVAMTVDSMPSELFVRASANGRLMTHTVGTRWDLTVAEQTNIVFETNVRASFEMELAQIGETLWERHGHVFIRIVDCANRYLTNVVGNISPTSRMQEFVDGVRTVPYSGFGSFAFINVPAGTYYLQAWGFANDADIRKGYSGLTLVGETELIVPNVTTKITARIFAGN